MDASGHGLGAALLQDNIEKFELDNASQIEGKFLEFRNRLQPISLLLVKASVGLKLDIQT